MSTISDEIRLHMAKAFFASAWADLQEEKALDDETCVSLSGCEIMDVMPDEIDPAAIHAARTLELDLARRNASPSLSTLYEFARKAQSESAEGSELPGDRTLNPEMFGHYLAMQAMGTGVGLRDAFGRAVADAINVPYVEFGSHSLQKDY